jgi:hypothetical protein
MAMKVKHIVYSAVAILLLWCWPNKATAQEVETRNEASRSVALQNVNLAEPTISGVIVNQSPHEIRNVELLLQYHWLWKNEFKPGQDSPGRVVTVKLDKELQPGQSLPFTYTPQPPLPSRSDGHFEPEVIVSGFTAVIPQQVTSR